MLGMKQKISIVLVFVIVMLLPGTVSFAEELELSSPIALLVEMETGQVLYEKNADQKWSPASTTKIMTALVAIENAELDTEMKASSNAIYIIPQDYGIAGIQPDEIMTLNDLLHFCLIISANEAANVIAENISPTHDIAGFVDMMNQKAEEFGLRSTHFTNAYGLEEENHYSSARDLVITARRAMALPVFREIVAKKTVPLPETNLKSIDDWDKWHISSTNRLLNSESEHYSRVTGIKTGYTDGAGRCLVFSAVNDEGLELVGVVLGAKDYDVLYKESQDLLEYGFMNYKVQTLVSSGEFFGRYEVVDAMDNIPVDLQILGTVSHLLPVSEEKLSAEVTVKETLNTPFTAPIQKGEVLGYKSWFYNGEEIGNVQLVAVNDIEKTLTAKIRDRVTELVNNKAIRLGAIVVVAFVLFLIILRIILKGISRKRNYSRRHYRI